MKSSIKYLGILSVLVFTIIIMGLMHNDLYTIFQVQCIQKYPIFQNRHNTYEGTERHPNSTVKKKKLKATSGLNIRKNIYYPGDYIPESKIRKTSELSHGVLKRRLSQKEYKRYNDLLRDTLQIFKDNDIRYIMADGTLLGSYFFHDIIPWDDDMDIMVDYQDYPRLKKAFQNETIWSKYNLCGFHDSFNEYEFNLLNKTYPDFDQVETKKLNKVQISNRTRFHKVKIFSTLSQKFKMYPWRWPFIDVTFYKYNRTHFWNHDGIQYFMPIETFFPFHSRLFMGMWLSAPHKTGSFLKRKLGKSGTFACKSGPWNHKKEEFTKSNEKVSVSCDSLNNVYVKVQRSKLENGKTNESAVLSNQVLYSVYVDENFDDVQLE